MEKKMSSRKRRDLKGKAKVLQRWRKQRRKRCSGDCEPVAIKFMELNALGNPHPRMDGMTDDLVDIMRKQFAMDYYKDGVVPVYVENETK
ncbi:hypothetical protein Bca52824_058552 [Brassica carinata]|uniref:Ubiquitin-like protease family profile domain-containing protein n=1 Tax=Brassica carinata TaxID=52824 RepID=A0A8X7QU64_BRACI|nr:hypothetical protein Bca52824_058552 [Brassica carinata]